ncbi:MAG TPA: hypothetical protein VMW36_04115 [Patescibacteria group bacterium]|nr:hypothetical protein [Patescibacteria group bacterium]
MSTHLWVIEAICKGGSRIAKTKTYRTRAEARRVAERLNGSNVLRFVEYRIRKYIPVEKGQVNDELPQN